MRIVISIFTHRTALLIPSNEGNIVTLNAGNAELDAAVSARCGIAPEHCRALLHSGGLRAKAIAPLYTEAFCALLYQVRAHLKEVLRTTEELEIKLLGADFAGLEELASSCLSEPGCQINVQAIPAQALCVQS